MKLPRTAKECRKLGFITAYEAARWYPVSRTWVYRHCRWHGGALHKAFFSPQEIEQKLQELREEWTG